MEMKTGEKATALAKRLNKLHDGGTYATVEEWDAIYARETTKAGAKATSQGGDLIDMGDDWFVHFHHGAFHAIYSPTRMVTVHPLRVDPDGITTDIDGGHAMLDLHAIHAAPDPANTMTVIVPQNGDDESARAGRWR